MNTSVEQILKPSMLQALSHRSEEKRKLGRLELERVIYIEADRSPEQVVQALVSWFRLKYLKSQDLSRKVVGLEVMVTILSAVQHKPEVQARFQRTIVGNILECLIDSEAKIRSLAFAKIFEVIRMFKDDFMRFFNQIFEKIIVCINDIEPDVKNSCELIDKKLRSLFHDHCCSHNQDSEFDVGHLVTIIKSKIKTLNLEVRHHLITWINQFLELELVVHVGEFLQDLLMMSSNNDIEAQVNDSLSCFFLTIEKKFGDGSLEREVGLAFINGMMTTLIRAVSAKGPSKTKLQTLKWFKLFFALFSQQVTSPRPQEKLYFKKIVIERFDQILEPILLLMSYEEEEVRRESINVNSLLKESIEKVDKAEPINIIKIVPLLKEALSQRKASTTSQQALNWMKFMLQNYQGKIIPGMMEVVSQVMEKIYEGSAKNIYEIIEIMKSKEDYFELMIQKMLQFLNKKVWQQQDRTELMLKKFINPKDIALLWTSICKHIDNYLTQSLFMYEVASALNSIIIHENNMKEVRYFLTNWAAPNYLLYYLRMFKILKYNPPTAISLCLLSDQYELAHLIIGTLTGKREINAKVLLGLCKLVSQIQSPAFISLRMHMLDNDDPFLMESLNSLLMILPQGKIFNMLRKRLEAVSLMPARQGQSRPRHSIPNPVNVELLFADYKQVYGLE